MSTLIEVRNNSGLVGRCDAKCYEATEPECTCICKGHNHRAGFKQAQDNTMQMSKALIKKYGKGNIIFPDEGKQLQLF